MEILPKPPSSSSHQSDETVKVEPAANGIPTGTPLTSSKANPLGADDAFEKTKLGALGDWFKKTNEDPPRASFVSPWNLI